MNTTPAAPNGRLTTTRSSWETAVVVFAWLVAVASAVGQWVLQARAVEGGALDAVLEPTDFTGALLTVAVATVGAVVVLRGAALVYGWLMVGVGAVVGVVEFAAHYSVFGLDVDVPLVTASIWIQDQWLVIHFAVFLLAALFPDGRPASARWRIPVRIITIAWVALILLFAFADRDASNFFESLGGRLAEVPGNATGFLAIPEVVFEISWGLLVLVSVVVGFGSLVSRWRRADADLRLRLKWVLFALGVLLAVLAIDVTSQFLTNAAGMELDLRFSLNLAFAAAQVGLVIGLGFGVLRFRLYDVDLVISRTIVYGILTVLVMGAYVAVVVGVGALLPLGESALALVATGVVAVAFAPLRGLVQAWVNRLVFGQRDDPYAVLAKLGRLLAVSKDPEATLEHLVETVGVSLKLPGVAIELEEDGSWREWASYGDTEFSEPEVTRIPLRHRGEVVGRLLATPRSLREPLTPKDLSLLEDIAHHAGAAAGAVRLTRALQRSRERLVLAQEEERRRIRHDLHDELGPSLASQTFQLDAALERIGDDPEATKTLLAGMKEQNKHLVADIRRLVYGLRPPALDELGVAGALAVQASQLEKSDRMHIDLRTRPDPLPKLPAAVEVAAYRIAREAIVNAVRHADAGACTTTLEASGNELIVTVEDDGIGVDHTGEAGVGMTSMRERTEELGGTLEVVSPDGGGTRIRASIPLVTGSVVEGGTVSHG